MYALWGTTRTISAAAELLAELCPLHRPVQLILCCNTRSIFHENCAVCQLPDTPQTFGSLSVSAAQAFHANMFWKSAPTNQATAAISTHQTSQLAAYSYHLSLIHI